MLVPTHLLASDSFREEELHQHPSQLSSATRISREEEKKTFLAAEVAALQSVNEKLLQDNKELSAEAVKVGVTDMDLEAERVTLEQETAILAAKIATLQRTQKKLMPEVKVLQDEKDRLKGNIAFYIDESKKK